MKRFVLAACGAVFLIGVFLINVPAVHASASAKILIERKGCLTCHSLNGRGGKMGPPLQSTPSWSPPERMRAYLADPKSVNPASIMPNLHLSEEQIETIVEYLQSFKDEAKAPDWWKEKK
ncbi:MAG: c-type cytochrome [Leptospirillia bacterium]